MPEAPSAPFWSEREARCRRAVGRVRDVVDGLPAGAGRDWLAALAVDLDRQLAAVRRTARCGELLDRDPDLGTGSGADAVSPAVRDCADRLDAAARDLDDVAERVAAVAVSLVPAPDLGDVRDQLDVLSTQAPLLRPPRQTPTAQVPTRQVPSGGVPPRAVTPQRYTESFRDGAPLVGTGAAMMLGAGAAWLVPDAPSLTLRLTCLSLLAIAGPMLLGGLTVWLAGSERAERHLRGVFPTAVVGAFLLLFAGAFADGIAAGLVLLAALTWPIVLAGGCGVASAVSRRAGGTRR